MREQYLIPFNKSYFSGNEIEYLKNLVQDGNVSSDGFYTTSCENWLERNLDVRRALLVPSCTAALEMAALIANIRVGDEVILPSYTFVSTANAFVLRGAVLKFIDVRPDTLNLDENQIEKLITKKTKAIIVVHYAGVACNMDSIMSIANKHRLLVIEDAAQGIGSYYKNKPLGSIGDYGCISFHNSKNISCGEGGSLIVNVPEKVTDAEIIREKGTDRSRYLKGEVDKYTWRSIGSSYVISEYAGAVLKAQLEVSEFITKARLKIWSQYNQLFAELSNSLDICLPTVPKDCKHNGHMYYVLLSNEQQRASVLKKMNEEGINATFHYLPLHLSPFGLKNSISKEKLLITESVSQRILRLPLWVGMSEDQVERVVNTFKKSIANV